MQCKWLGEESPISVSEAHGTRNGYFSTGEGLRHGRNLPAHALDQIRAIASAHIKPNIGPKHPTFVSFLNHTGIVLCVHDPNTRRRHDEMIDIGPTPRHLSVMEDDNAATNESLQSGGQLAFADRTLPEG